MKLNPDLLYKFKIMGNIWELFNRICMYLSIEMKHENTCVNLIIEDLRNTCELVSVN